MGKQWQAIPGGAFFNPSARRSITDYHILLVACKPRSLPQKDLLKKDYQLMNV